jgi:hypothetical protein
MNQPKRPPLKLIGIKETERPPLKIIGSLDDTEKKNPIQNVAPTTSKPSKTGSLPFQTPVDSSKPSVLLNDEQKLRQEQDRIGKRFETEFLNVPTEFGKVGRVMQAAKQVKDNLPQAPQFRKYGQIPMTQPTEMTEGQRLGDSLTKGEGFQDVITDKVTGKKTGLQKQIEAAQDAFRQSQGEALYGEVQGAQQLQNAMPESVEVERERKGNYVEYLYNQFLDGTGSAVSGLIDFGLAIDKNSPTASPMSKSGLMLDYYRKKGSKGVKSFLKDNIGFEVDKGLEAKYNEGMLTGAIGGLASSAPAMLTGGMTKGLSMAAQMYDGAIQSVESMPNADQWDNDTKTLFAGTLGLIQGQLERYGLDKVLKGGELTNVIFKKILNSSAGKEVTGNILEDLIDENVKGVARLFARGGVRAIDGFASEFYTGAGQEAAAIGVENLFDKVTGKPIFNTSNKTDWIGFIDRIVKAGGEEGLGGSVLGGGVGMLSAASKKKVKESQAVINEIDKQLDSPIILPEIEEILLQRKADTQADIDDVVDAEADAQSKMSPEDFAKSQELSEQIEKIELVLQDPNTGELVKADLEAKKQAIEKEIEEIIKKAPAVAQPRIETEEDVIKEIRAAEKEFNETGDTAEYQLKINDLNQRLENLVPAPEDSEIGKPTFEKVPIFTRTEEEIEYAKNEVFDNLSKLEVGSVIENSDGEIKIVTEKSTDKKGNQLIGVTTYTRQADGSLLQMTNPIWAQKSANGKIKLDYNPHETGTNSKGERVTTTDQITDKKIDLSKENVFATDENGDLIQINKVEPTTAQPTQEPTVDALKDEDIILSGLRDGFKGITRNSFDFRGDPTIEPKISNQESFVTKIARKGKEYIVVGLRLKDIETNVSGRDGYSFAVIEDNGNLPNNAIETLTQKAVNNISSIYPNIKNPDINIFNDINIDENLKTDAIQEQTAGQVPVQPEAPTSQEGSKEKIGNGLGDVDLKGDIEGSAYILKNYKNAKKHPDLKVGDVVKISIRDVMPAIGIELGNANANPYTNEPISVNVLSDGTIRIIDGHNRFKKALLNKDKEVKIKVVKTGGANVYDSRYNTMAIKAVKEGRVTAKEAKSIIEKSGLEVPKEIEEQFLREQSKADGSNPELVEAVENLLKPKTDAIPQSKPSQIPVQPEAPVSKEVEQGKPESKAEGVTEEGKEIKTTSAPEQKLTESRKGGEVFPYKGEEYLIQKENEGEISAFSIVNKENVALETIPNKDLKSFQNPIAVSKEVVEKADINKPIIIGDTGSDYFVLDGNHRLTKAMLEGKDIQAYVLTPEQTKKIKLENGKAKKYKTETPQAEVTPKTETKSEPKVVTEEGKQEEVARLRAEEQVELNKAIPNAEQYQTDGKVDRAKITDAKDLKKFDEIYDKYDKLITPLLPKKETKAEAPAKTKPLPKAKVATRLAFEKAVNLFYDISAADGSAKKGSLSRKRQRLLEQNPSIKYIDDNWKAISEQLESKGLLTKSKDCP